jgi:hypothetical protein
MEKLPTLRSLGMGQPTHYENTQLYLVVKNLRLVDRIKHLEDLSFLISFCFLFCYLLSANFRSRKLDNKTLEIIKVHTE